jgi:antirestriction protein ArdC
MGFTCYKNGLLGSTLVADSPAASLAAGSADLKKGKSSLTAGGQENHASISRTRLRNWIAKLEEDNRLIIHAAANAQRAVDCILGSTRSAWHGAD